MVKDYFISNAKYVKLDFNINHHELLDEAIACKTDFVTHRSGNYDHKGWKSLVLHGWSEQQSGHWKDYGYHNISEVIKDMHWTSVSQKCPKTVEFLKNNFPSKSLGRVRFMLLEAGGHIAEHSDSSVPMLDNTNISLSNHQDCIWQWGDGESLFMKPGNTYVMNIHYPHAVYNNSNYDRYHLIIHRFDSTDEWKRKLSDACKEQNISGQYKTHEVLT